MTRTVEVGILCLATVAILVTVLGVVERELRPPESVPVPPPYLFSWISAAYELAGMRPSVHWWRATDVDQFYRCSEALRQRGPQDPARIPACEGLMIHVPSGAIFGRGS